MITEKANIIRQNRRSIKIIITENGDINIYAPKQITNSEIERLVGNKENWAFKRSQKQREKFVSNSDIYNYKSILICGKVHEIKYAKIKKIGVVEGYFVMPEKYFQEKSKTLSALKKWFKGFGEELLIARTIQLSKDTGLKFTGIKIGNFRAKWGSCDSNKEIKLNYKLSMLPYKLIDAVILHELVHTKEMNHSTKFYTKLISIMPEYKKYRAELKEYGYLLKMY